MDDPWKHAAPPEIEEYGEGSIRCDGCTREHHWLVRVGEVRQWDADGAARLCVKCLRAALALGVKRARKVTDTKGNE